MPDINNNRKVVYDALVSSGYSGLGKDFDEFCSYMDKDENRQVVYNALQNEGYTGIGNDYNEFCSYIYEAPKVEDDPQKQFGGWDKIKDVDYMKPEGSVNLPRTEYVTATEEQRMGEKKPQYFSLGESTRKDQPIIGMDEADYSHRVDRMLNGGRMADDKSIRYMNEGEFAQRIDDKLADIRRFNELKGKQGITVGRKDIIEDNGRFYTPAGSYNSYEEAAHYVDANNLSKEDNELKKAVQKDIENDYYREQLGGLYDTLKELKDEQRVHDIQERTKYVKERGIGQFLKDAVMNIPVAETQHLQGVIPSSDYDLTEKGKYSKEQNEALTAAGRLYNEAQAIMQAAKGGNFMDGLDKALNSMDTWSSGQQARDNIAIQNVVDKWEEGKALTKAEQALLDSLAIKAAVSNKYQDEISNWYNAGAMVGEMAPFMVEMIINPLSGLSKKAAYKFSKYALDKFGKKAISKVAKAAGGLTGAVAGGYGMALTTGLPAVGVGVQERMLGNAKYDIDDNGNIEYAGQEGGKGLARSVWEEVTARAIDNATEMTGAGYAGSLGKKVVKTAKGKKLFGWINELANTKWGKGFDEFFKATNWNGPIEEFLEEIHAGIANAALVGDQSLKEFFSKDNLATIAIGVAVPGVAMSTAQMAGGVADGSYKIGASERKKMVEAGYRGDALWQAAGKFDEWRDFQNSVSFGTLEDVDNLLTEINNDNSLSNEEKMVAFDYAIHTLRLKTALGVKEATSDERMSDIDSMLSEIYSSASSQTPTAVEVAKSNEKLAKAEQVAKDALGVNTEESIEKVMDGRTVEEVAMGDEDLANKLNNYFKAKAEDEGRRAAIEDKRLARYSEVDLSIDNTANKQDGNVYSTKTDDGKEIFITGGTVVLTEDGLLSPDSDKLVALMPNGKHEAVDYRKLPGKFEVSNAEEMKAAKHAEIDAEIEAEFSAPVEVVNTSVAQDKNVNAQPAVENATDVATQAPAQTETTQPQVELTPKQKREEVAKRIPMKGKQRLWTEADPNDVAEYISLVENDATKQMAMADVYIAKIQEQQAKLDPIEAAELNDDIAFWNNVKASLAERVQPMQTAEVETSVESAPAESSVAEQPVEVTEQPVAEVAPAVESEEIEQVGNSEQLTNDVKTEDVNQEEVGPFGRIYRQFKGKAKEAIQFLLGKKEGEAVGALSHPEIGEIDLVWGEEGTSNSDGYGLAKLAKYHPEVLENLQEIINDMHVTNRSANRVQLESDTHQAAVRLTWDNKSKNWLLTAFEKKNSVSDNTTDTGETSNGGKQNDTATLQNTVSESEDRNSVSKEQENTQKSDENTQNSGEIQTTTVNTPAQSGVVDMNTMQPAMREEDFNALLNNGDEVAIREYLNGVEEALLVNDASPFAGMTLIREEAKKVAEQYGGKENIPAEVLNALNERMKPYSELSRVLFDRKYALEDRLRELEAVAKKEAETKKKEVKVENKISAFGGFLADKTDFAASTAEKALSKKYNFDGKAITVAEFVEDAVSKGDVKLSTIEEPKYKGASRAAWNRMDAKQQEADAKKVKESGTKTVYTVNDHNLGKTAYDYAKFLLDKKAEQEKAAAKQKVKDAIEPFAKEKAAEQAPIKIEDVGEKIGGARKDIIRQYADKIKLDGKTFSTMFPKPDIDKLVEAGLPKDKVAAVKAMYDNAKREFEITKKRRGKDRALQASLFYAMYAKNVLTGEEGNFDLAYNGFVFTEWGKEFMKANIALYKAVFNKLGTDYGKVDLRSYFITPLAAGMGKNFNLKKLNEVNSRRQQRMAEMDGRKVPEYKDGDLINFVGEHYSRPSDQFETLEEAVNTMVERISKEVKVDEAAQYKVESYWKRDAQGRADYSKAYLGIKVRGFGTVDVMEFKNMNEARAWLQDHREDFQQMAAAKEEQVRAENKKPLPKYILGHSYNEAQSQYSVFADFGKEGVKILKTFNIPQAEGVAARAKVRSEVYKNDVLPYMNSEEALSLANGFAQEIRDAKNAKQKPVTVEKKSRERVGVDWRNGKDATPDMFVDVEGKEPSVFGFRAIEFGNYVTQKERQQYLNDLYDALMDMSELLGVSPRALSLGGRLALAVGARGTSGASGHYEPYKNVINITKTSGAGVLAHEWLHAFDRYFSNFDENALYPNGVMYATQGMFADDTRQEVKDAFERVMTTIKGSDYQKRSMLLGEYWASNKELAARALQDYIRRKLDDRGQTNDFLSNHVAPEEWDGDAKGYPFPLGEDVKRIADAFDNLFATLEEKTTDDGNVVLYRTAEDIENEYPNWLEGTTTDSGKHSTQVEGFIADREVVMDSDPYSKAMGRPRYTGKKMQEYVARQREKMTAKVQELAKKLNLDVEVLVSTEGLTGKKAKAKGWYEPKGKRIVVVIPNHTSVNDAVATVLHEAVAHHGLRELFGENFDTFLQNVFNNADADVRTQITRLAKQRYNGNILTATEEYLASLAENTDFENATKTGWWEKIKEYFFKMLRDLGIEDFGGITLTDNELRYVLWRSYQNLVNPGMYNNVFTQAKDIAKQYELKVGNYAPAMDANAVAVGEDFLARVPDETIDAVNEFTLNNYGAARVILADGVEDLQELLTAWDFNPKDIDEVIELYNKGTLAMYMPKYDKVIIFDTNASRNEIIGYLWHENAHKAVGELFTEEEMIQIFKTAMGKDEQEIRNELSRIGYSEAEQAEEYVVRMVEDLVFVKPDLLDGKFKPKKGATEEWKNAVEKVRSIIKYIKNGTEEEYPGGRGGRSRGAQKSVGQSSKKNQRRGTVEVWNSGHQGENTQGTADDTRFRIEENSIDNVPSQPLTFAETPIESEGDIQIREKPALETETTEGTEQGVNDSFLNQKEREAVELQDANEVALASENIAALGEKLNTPVNVVNDIDSLPDGLRNKKGWYDRKTGVVTVVLPNHISYEDAVQTALHEIVGHKGLQAVLGDKMGAFLDFVYNNLPKNSKSRINNHVLSQNMKGNPMTQRLAVEEYIAQLAERGFEGYNGLWNGVKQWMRDFFRNFMNVEVSDGELRYMLWKNYQRLQMPSMMSAAMDMAMETVTNTGDNGLRFREAEPGIGEQYEKAVTGSWNKIKQGYYDQLRSVRKALALIAKSSGKKILDSEDVYSFAEHLPSINKIMKEQFDLKFYNPFVSLLRKLHDIKLDGKNIDDKTLERYTNVKHGLERNREMAVKDALTAVEEVNGKKVPTLNKDKYADWMRRKAEIVKNEKLSWEEKQRELDKLALSYGAKLKDYSGLSAIFKADKDTKYVDMREEAIGFVNSIEKALDDVNRNYRKEFWELINGMTKYSLENSYKSGLISKDVFDNVLGMYEFYVPLRGFSEVTAEDVFDYVASENRPLGGVLKRAHGRTSEAENIFATIMNMANSAIVMGNKNKLKQMVLNLAMRHSTPLLSVDNAWYRKVGDEYVVELPDINEGMTEQDMADAHAAFEARMKEAEKKGEVVRHSPGLNIARRVVNDFNMQQHAIRVKRNGKEYVVWVNGSPTFANAINGLLKEQESSWIGKKLDSINKFRAQAVTQYSPTFVFTNLFRDVQSASTVYGVMRGMKALAMFEKNLAMNTGRMMNLYLKYKHGSLDVNKEVERLFKEFLENGGETGYTEMISIEEYQKALNDVTQKLNIKNATGRAFEFVGDGIEFANRCVENLCRFSAYMTSRQLGMSIMKSVNDAKEVSVNFNRKGSGEMGAKELKTAFMFFNPAVQSVAQRILLAQKYPKRMIPVLALELAAGASMPLLFSALSALFGFGDDDENDSFEERFNRRLGNYYNLSDFRRRSSICMPTANGVINIPLSHEARVFFGIGELAVSIANGHEKYDNIPSQFVDIVGQALPINPVEGWNFGENLGQSLMYNLTPDAIKPFVEIGMNRDFAGNKIHNRSDFNEHLPEYMRGKKGTAEIYNLMSKALSGDRSGFGKSWFDENAGALINPSNLEHLVEGYLGGAYTFVDKAVKSAKWALGDEEFAEFRNIPIGSSFYTSLRKYEESPVAERTRRDWEDAFKFYQKEIDLLDGKEKSVKAAIKQAIPGADSVFEDMNGNGETLAIDVFDDGYKVIKELYSDADAAKLANDFDRLEEINEEIYAQKRLVVERMEILAENPRAGYGFLVGKDDSAYGKMETYGDLKDVQTINDMQRDLKAFDEGYKKSDDKGSFYKENKKALDLYENLNRIERVISDVKKRINNDPDFADEGMGIIRERRTDAINLIFNYYE